MDERLPQYLHRPVQILWFGSDEFILVMSTIFVGLIVGGLIGWSLVGALLLSSPGSGRSPAVSCHISPGAGDYCPFPIIQGPPRPASTSEGEGKCGSLPARPVLRPIR